jgi:hypothetical protein
MGTEPGTLHNMAFYICILFMIDFGGLQVQVMGRIAPKDPISAAEVGSWLMKAKQHAKMRSDEDVLVIYNRVPKTGSGFVKRLLDSLSETNHFSIVRSNAALWGTQIVAWESRQPTEAEWGNFTHFFKAQLRRANGNNAVFLDYHW